MDVLKQFKHIKKEIARMQSVSGTDQYDDYEKQVKVQFYFLGKGERCETSRDSEQTSV